MNIISQSRNFTPPPVAKTTSEFDKTPHTPPNGETGPLPDWRDLPDDIKEIIFSQLDGVSLAAVGTICKDFQRICNNQKLWCQAYETEWGNKRFPTVETERDLCWKEIYKEVFEKRAEIENFIRWQEAREEAERVVVPLGELAHFLKFVCLAPVVVPTAAFFLAISGFSRIAGLGAAVATLPFGGAFFPIIPLTAYGITASLTGAPSMLATPILMTPNIATLAIDNLAELCQEYYSLKLFDDKRLAPVDEKHSMLRNFRQSTLRV